MTAGLRDELLVAIAAVGLPGSLRELPGEGLPAPEVDALVSAAREHRIAGMVLASAATGDLRLPPEVMAVLRDLHGREVAGSRRLESELLWVASALDATGIESRVLGDVAVTRLGYRDPTLRAVSSIGLLVHPADVNHAIALLRGSGWQARPDRHGGAGLNGPSGQQLELHTTLHPTPPGVRVEDRTLWADSRELRIAQRKLFALGDAQRLLHACCHAAVGADGPEAVVRQRDVVEAVLFGTWDRARLMALTGEWNAEEVLGRAVREAWQRLAIADVTALSVWARAGTPGIDRQPRHDPSAVPAPRLPSRPAWRRGLLARHP